MSGSCLFPGVYRNNVTLDQKVPLSYLVWFRLVWFSDRWTKGEVGRLAFSEGKKNAVAFGVVSCNFPRKSYVQEDR
jgi:hypothetical protein